MRKPASYALLVLIFALAFSLQPGAQSISSELSGAAEKQKGISYAAWGPGLYSQPDSDISLAHLAETGAGWISLIVTCYQDNLGSVEIAANETTPTDEDLIHAIGQAHALGLKVMLKPHLDLSKDPAHWRGEIGTAFSTETQWADWFASYQRFIEHYADLARAQAADQFCVGTELLGTSPRETEWRRVIAGVRSRYSGPIIYAANHSGEEIGVTWWDAVDYIGVDAYYPLASKNDPTLAELKAAWKPHASTLAGLFSRWQKPVILTEIGYRSLDGAASHPWDWQIQGKVDLKEQEDCYQAAFESVWNEPWFAGIYWWSWGPDPLEGGPYDTGFTPHDKPAEDTLRVWFGGAARRALLFEPEANYSRTVDIFIDGLGPGWVDWSWGAERELGATDNVHRGAASVRLRLDPWGALSLGHAPFSSYLYYWLEFSICGSSGPEPLLWVYLYDADGRVLLRVPVNDRRFIERGKVESGRWKLVSIPLRDLGAARKMISRISLQDRSGLGTADFWIDDLRLVGAKWRKEHPRPGRK